jgi:hypothetical protein
MTINETFKAKIKEGKLKDALISVMSEAVELKITTWVSNPEDSVNQPSQPIPGHYIRTRMNILDGDIDNEIGSQFINKKSYSELQQFHLEQVKEGHQIVQTNLENIHKMFALLSDSLSHLP